MNKENIKKYYNAICKDLKIEPVKINFKSLKGGVACIVHNNKGLIYSIDIDINKCSDVEYAILHETAHQILILKNNNYRHNKTFKSTENKLIDKYMYSKFSEVLYYAN